MSRAPLGILLSLLLLLGAPPGTQVRADEENEEIPSEFPETFGEADAPKPPWEGVLLPFGARRMLRDFEDPLGRGRVAKTVDAALAWLAAHQCADGRWSAQQYATWCHGKRIRPQVSEGAYLDGIDPGVTGLSVLAFLAAGHEPWGPGPYGKTLADAVVWLIHQQGEDGLIATHRGPGMVSGHAYATWALVEAFGVTGQTAVGGAAQSGLNGLEHARNPYFAWRYGIKPGDNDTPTTGDCLMPFVAARRINAACARRGLAKPLHVEEQVFDGARAWVDKMTDPDYARTGYIQRGGPSSRYEPGPSMDRCPPDLFEGCTALGILVRLAGTAVDAEARRSEEINEHAFTLLAAQSTEWAAGKIDLYAWMYSALAMEQLAQASSRYEHKKDAWFESLAEVLVPAQRTDGDVCAAKGSWDPIGAWGWAGGRVYATSMAVLALLAPIRYVPVKDEADTLAKLARERDLPVARRIELLDTVARLDDERELRGLLAKLLKDKEPRLRLAALAHVPRLEKAPKSIAKRVLQLAERSDDAEVRVAALATLAQLGAGATEHAAAFRAALRAPDEALFRGVAKVLRGVEPVARALWGDLEGLLARPDALRSAHAAAVLHVHEPTHAKARAVLRAQVRSTEEAVVEALEASIGWSVPGWAKVSDAQVDFAFEHDLPVAFRGPLETRFVLVPPGTFRMGSPDDEQERLSDETLHDVTITTPYYVQIREVTNAQYARMVPKHETGGFPDTPLDGPELPVMRVGHVEAAAFATWLSERSDRWAFRLPTEAEWEHAARAGTATRFWWGDDEARACKHDDVADETARRAWPQGFGQFVESTPQWRWFEGDDGRVGTNEALTRTPNPWGLYAVHGNAAEWCADWKGDYPTEAVTDPTGARSGSMRVYRGGSWVGSPQQCRAAMRGLLPRHLQPGAPCAWIGFRLVAVPRPPR